MRAGQLRNRIELQRATEARDSYGEAIQTWSTYDRVWARVQGGAGSERVVGQQVTGRAGVLVTIRYRNPEPVITERVKFGSRLFDINDVENVGQRNHELVLTCTEVSD